MRQLYLILTVCALGVTVMLVSLSALSGMSPDQTREGVARDRRVNELEQALKQLQTLQQVTPRKADGLEGVQELLEALKTDRRAAALVENYPQNCPVGLSNLQSKEAMTAAGWEADVSQEKFKDDEVYWGGHYIGWKDGNQIGTLKVRFNVSGKIYLSLRNDHASYTEKDFVSVWLNEELLAWLTSKKEQQLCIPFQPGDVLRIEEHYGVIRLLGASVFCSSFDQRVDAVQSRRQQCAAGQTVYVKQISCFRPTWLRARVEKILDESRAVVRLEERALANTSLWQAHPASRLWLAGDLSGAPCSSFAFERKPIGIVQIADGLHLEKFQTHFNTQRCYAQARGYDYWLLDIRSWPACHKYSIWGASMFFEKHCIARAFLELQEPGYVAIVIDTDVVPAVLDRGVEEWLREDSDVHLYERVTGPEIAAGNYIVRNTPWAKNFLFEWSERALKIPKGYSSYDNGALHLFIIEHLRLEGSQKCRKLYEALDVDVEHWDANHANLSTYYSFVSCAKKVLGPARTWRSGDGGVTVWPRAHSFIVDGIYFSKVGSVYFGPVLHHGIKQKSDLEGWYFSDVGKCEVNAKNVLMDHDDYSKLVKTWISQYQSFDLKGEQWCVQCTEKCVSTLSCRPLAPDAEPHPKYRNLNLLRQSGTG